MRRDQVNKDPERARKRAVSDLRCAIRKLGIPETLRQLIPLAIDMSHQTTADAIADHILAMIPLTEVPK